MMAELLPASAACICRKPKLSQLQRRVKGVRAAAYTSGVMVAYATAPGRTAADTGSGGGPYVKALAEELVKPHGDVSASGPEGPVLEAFIARYKATFYAELARAGIELLKKREHQVAAPQLELPNPSGNAASAGWPSIARPFQFAAVILRQNLGNRLEY